ncbi:MAG: hypothetical protein ACI85O_001845, partial [Saprospiraceae bacterium]
FSSKNRCIAVCYGTIFWRKIAEKYPLKISI